MNTFLANAKILINGYVAESSNSEGSVTTDFRENVAFYNSFCSSSRNAVVKELLIKD